MEWLRYIPKNYVSWFIGKLAHIPLPWPLNEWSICIFANSYRIDLNAATRPVREFRSIGEFFTRDMREDIRPIANGLVCPVDGTMRACSPIEGGGTLTQVKGVDYSVASLLGNATLSSRFLGGRAWTFYLSPRDSHHIHSPVDGEIIETIHIPGKLWPVNDWAIKSVPGLFAVNERVVTFIQSTHGLFAVVMVGATNVGKISLSYDELVTNVKPWERKSQKDLVHNPSIPISRGKKLGTFHMGSSVVLLSERRINEWVFSEEEAAAIPVRFGQDLGVLCGNFSTL